MATLNISQPDGIGDLPENRGGDDLWVDQPVEFTLSEGATYAHYLLDRVDGSALTFYADASTPFSSSRIATLTFDAIGSYRGRSVHTSVTGTQTIFTWVLRVQRDSSGALVNDGIVAPSRGEIPSEAPEADGRGAATLMDRLFAALRGIPTVAWSAGPIAVAGKKVVPYAGPSDVMLVHAPNGHEDGAIRVLTFAAGDTTSCRVSPDMNVRGDCAIDPDSYLVTDWDPDLPHTLFLERIAGITYGTLRAGSPSDVSTPVILSAKVDTLDANALVVTFDRPMVVRVLTGLSLPFSVGTPRTLVAIESGDGTTTVKFTLSGNVSSGDVFSFAVASNRAASDFRGNKLPVGSTSVTVVSGLVGRAAWTTCFEKGVAMLPSAGLPAALTSWTDQVGGSLQIVQTAGGGSASRTTGGLSFTSDATERCKASAALTSGSDFAFYVRCKFNTGGAHDWIPVAFDKDGSSTFPWVFLRLISDGTNGTAIASVYESGGVYNELSYAFSGMAAEHDFFVWRSGGQLHMQIDGVVATPQASTANVTGLSAIALGSALVPTAYKPDNGTVIHLGTKSNAGFVGTEIEDTRTYSAAV